MKRLFISDLDGTLLSSDAEVTEFTERAVNSFVQNGGAFTFATARSVYSAKLITSRLDINVPCILMNGVSIYDLKSGRYIKNEYIPESALKDIVTAYSDNGLGCFMYKLHREALTAYFSDEVSPLMLEFAEERRRRFAQPFVKCGDIIDAADGETVYFSSVNDYEKLLPVKNIISQISGVDYAFYEDTYTRKCYLEVFSERASKANGLKFLRHEYGFDEVVCFGDNLNDLPMFAESDIRVAVDNAKNELKAKADYIALSNDNNGVAEFLIKNERTK